MEIIVTHDNSDFDAFSSMVAATHLYPGARMVLGKRTAKSVRDYLALHKDRFETLRFEEFDHEAVTRLIVVDVRRADRLEPYGRVIERARKREVEVHIYDHHAATPHDLVGDVEVVEPVGSATTLLVELLRDRGVSLDADEATLMALGIQADTGSLTYARTTPRDAEAYAWTLAHGANLAVVNRYLNSGFDEDQRGVLSRMLGHVKPVRVGKVDVGTVIVDLEKAVPDLGSLVGELAALERWPAVLAVFPTGGKRSFVVGRATVPYVDVAAAVSAVGGGGHRGAAAAVVKQADGSRILDELVTALRADPPRPAQVGDVMTSPVRSVEPATLLTQAEQMMDESNIRGVVVLDEAKVVGVLSRRDLKKAHRDGRMHLKVSSCMAHRIHTIDVGAPLEDALARMSDADVGRLPVMREGRLVGIVTRADLLGVLYGESESESE